MPINHEYTDEVVCPWCGYTYSDSWDFFRKNELRSEGHACEECGKHFDIEREFSISYITYKKNTARPATGQEAPS